MMYTCTCNIYMYMQCIHVHAVYMCACISDVFVYLVIRFVKSKHLRRISYDFNQQSYHLEITNNSLI